MPNAINCIAICYVTDGRAFPAAERREFLLERIAAAIDAGADWVQIREKDFPARELLRISRDAVKIAAQVGSRTRVVVNDRLDVALAAGAAGVHLGRESLPADAPTAWRRTAELPEKFLVGISCHSVEEVRTAETLGADYIFFGPVFDTPAKRQFGAPQGIARLAEVCRATRIPVFAIGGINEQNARECLRAGAAGIAAIRLFQEASASEQLHEFIWGLRNSE